MSHMQTTLIGVKICLLQSPVTAFGSIHSNDGRKKYEIRPLSFDMGNCARIAELASRLELNCEAISILFKQRICDYSRAT
jgi:hypothetical protein